MTIVLLVELVVTHRNASQSRAFYHRRPQPISVTYLSVRQERFLVNFFRPSVRPTIGRLLFLKVLGDLAILDIGK